MVSPLAKWEIGKFTSVVFWVFFSVVTGSAGTVRPRAGAGAGASVQRDLPHPTQPGTSSRPSRRHELGSRLSEPGACFHFPYKYKAFC